VVLGGSASLRWRDICQTFVWYAFGYQRIARPSIALFRLTDLVLLMILPRRATLRVATPRNAPHIVRLTAITTAG
jgi:hypothetical protein